MNAKLWSALQGAGRYAKSLAGAADAEYRDCSCCGAQREAESPACKCTVVCLLRALMPNPSLKLSTNGVSRWSAGAGPAAHFAPAAQRATPLAPA